MEKSPETEKACYNRYLSYCKEWGEKGLKVWDYPTFQSWWYCDRTISFSDYCKEIENNELEWDEDLEDYI